MKNILKSNMKAIIAFVVGLAIAGTIGIIYAASVASSDVSYSNSSSGSSATTVKAALDDLYTKVGSNNKVLEFNFGAGANDASSGAGWRGYLSFDTTWFYNNIKKIEAKGYNATSPITLIASKSCTSAYSSSITVSQVKSTSYTEMALLPSGSSSVDASVYPCMWLVAQNSSTGGRAVIGSVKLTLK